ncbi:MAG: hypothetical protein HRU40_01320 [Saprospiraceae bacterium]|nr:hypothetical protein [Saprospiraceae bacterium]
MINNLQASTLHASTHYAKIAYNRFEVTEATFLDGYFLYEGDRIRIDAPTYPELQIAAEKAANWFPKRPKYISFYHLDSIHAANWTYEEIRSILLHFD